MFFGGSVHEIVQHLRATRLRLHVLASLQGELALCSPVDAMIERRLWNDAFGNPGDIGRRDMHEARTRPALDDGPVQVHRTEQIRLERFVDWGIERHRRRGVDRDVDVARELRHTSGEVPVDHRDPFVQKGA